MATTGFLWTPYTEMRDNIAASTNFQTWVGAENAESAKISIYLFEQFEDIDADQYAVITQGEPVMLQRSTVGRGLAAFDWSSSVTFGFCQKVDEYSEASVGTFLTNVGNFLNDILGQLSTQVQDVKELGHDIAPLKFPAGDVRGYMKFFTVNKRV